MTTCWWRWWWWFDDDEFEVQKGSKKGHFWGSFLGSFLTPFWPLKSWFSMSLRVEEFYDVMWWCKLMMKWCVDDDLMMQEWCKEHEKTWKKGRFWGPQKEAFFGPFSRVWESGLKRWVTVSRNNFEQQEQQLGRDTTSVRSEARDARVLKPSRRATPLTSDRNGVTASASDTCGMVATQEC